MKHRSMSASVPPHNSIHTNAVDVAPSGTSACGAIMRSAWSTLFLIDKPIVALWRNYDAAIMRAEEWDMV